MQRLLGQASPSADDPERLSALESVRDFWGELVAALPYFAAGIAILLLTWIVAAVAFRSPQGSSGPRGCGPR